MESISANKQDHRETSLDEKQLISQKRTGIRGVLIYMIFLFLLFIRKPVLFFTGWMAKGGALTCAVFSMGLFIGLCHKDTDPPEVPFSYGGLDEHTYVFMVVATCIGSFIMMWVGIAANWFYDVLLLRLAPPEYELRLFK